MSDTEVTELFEKRNKSANPMSNVFLENFALKKKKLLLQSFIDAGEKDIRTKVIDNKVVVAMELPL